MLSAETTAGRRAARKRGNLPAALSSFVGREQAIAELHELLGAWRLITLTGAGGVGKTRLPLEVGSTVANNFSDGVWLVELASIVAHHVDHILSKVGVASRSAATAFAFRNNLL